MIPKEEIKESLELLLRCAYRNNSFLLDKEGDFKVLFDNGFYDIFLDEYLMKDNVCFNPGEKCHKTDFYIQIISKGGITDKLVSILADAATSSFPYTLMARLKGEIFSNEENKQKYLEAISRLQLKDFLELT